MMRYGKSLGKQKISAESILCFLIAVYFLACFFEAYLNQIIGSTMKFYIFAIVVVYVLFFGTKLPINFISKSYMIWFAYKVLTLLWTRDYYMFEIHIVAHIGIIILLTCLVSRPFELRTLSILAYTLWIGSALIGFLSIFSHTAYYGVSVRQVLTLFGVFTDPNNQAAFLLFGISIALYYIISEKKHIILGVATIYINMVSIMMTASRGGFVAAALIALLIILFMTESKKTKIWASLVIVIAAVVVLRYAGNFVSAESWDRIMIAEGYEGGSGRIFKWMNTIDLLNENPIYYVFGAGWGANWGYRGIYGGIHNTYLSHLCDTGLIGTVIFHYPIVKCIRYLWRRKEFLPVIIALTGLIPAVFLDTINKRFFWNALLYLFMYYIYSVRGNSDDKFNYDLTK